jgi:hypothetical protein
MVMVAREMRTVEAPTPEMKVMQASMAKAMEDSKPVLLKAIEEVREIVREQARAELGGGAAKAIETELSAGRTRAARFNLTSGTPEQRKAQMESMKEEMGRFCPSNSDRAQGSR